MMLITFCDMPKRIGTMRCDVGVEGFGNMPRMEHVGVIVSIKVCACLNTGSVVQVWPGGGFTIVNSELVSIAACTTSLLMKAGTRGQIGLENLLVKPVFVLRMIASQGVAARVVGDCEVTMVLSCTLIVTRGMAFVRPSAPMTGTWSELPNCKMRTSLMWIGKLGLRSWFGTRTWSRRRPMPRSRAFSVQALNQVLHCVMVGCR